MNIAIIPARAGSKRLKNKNLKTINGKPLIYYAINAAIKSKLFDDVIISTDSSKILNHQIFMIFQKKYQIMKRGKLILRIKLRNLRMKILIRQSKI